MNSTFPISKSALPHGPRPKLRFGSKASFSLIEVVIALGIIAFVLVPMMGLLTGGLSSIHTSVNNSVTSEIIDQVRATQEGATSNTLYNEPTTTVYYFDSQGVVTNQASSIYQATVYKPVSPTSSSLPSSSNPNLIFSGQLAAAQIYQIQVVVGYNPGGSLGTPINLTTNSVFVTPLD